MTSEGVYKPLAPTGDDVPSQLLAILGVVASGLMSIAAWTYRRVRNKTRSEIAGAVYFVIGRFVTRSIQLQLNAKQYYRTTLDSKSSRFLTVPGAHQTTLETDDSFISLTLELGISGAKTYTHENIASAGARLIVIGDPGSGKSTFVKRVLRDQCQTGLRRPRRERLPLLVNLKDFAPPGSVRSKNQITDWALKEISSRIKGVPGFQMDRLFDTYTQTTGLLLLLDGLDEVSSASYRRTIEAVRALSDRLEFISPNSVVIITMRKNFYQQTNADLRESFPTVLQVRPFSASDIYDFVTRWPFAINRRAEQINNIYNELSDRPNLCDMCRNPLILAMYVANYEGVSPEDLPDTRTEFYSKVTNELLLTRRRRQSGSRAGQITLKRQREEVLGTLALENLRSRDRPANQIQWSNALRVTKSVLGISDDEKAERAFGEILKETGVVEDEIPGETLKFIHLTFCEYLAAVEVKSRNQECYRDLLNDHSSFANSPARQARGRLLEVVPFVCALLEQRAARQDMLSRVESMGDWGLFARCLLETQAYDHPGWPRYEAAEGNFLKAVPHSDWTGEWLSRVHLYRTVLADATRCAALASSLTPPAEPFSKFFSSLIGDNSERVVELFRAFATEDSSVAFRFAEESGKDLLKLHPGLVVDSCASVPFLALAVERLRRGERMSEWAAILAESSLRYSVVAKRLENESDADLIQLVTAAGRSAVQWLRGERRTLQIACIENALHYRRHEPPNAGVAFLNLLSLVRMPGRVLSALRVAAYCGFAASVIRVAWAFIEVLGASDITDFDLLGFLGAVVLVVFMLFFAMGVSRALSDKHTLIALLLNWRSIIDHQSDRSVNEERPLAARLIAGPSSMLLRRGYQISAILTALRSPTMGALRDIDINGVVVGNIRGRMLDITCGQSPEVKMVQFKLSSPWSVIASPKPSIASTDKNHALLGEVSAPRQAEPV